MITLKKCRVREEKVISRINYLNRITINLVWVQNMNSRMSVHTYVVTSFTQWLYLKRNITNYDVSAILGYKHYTDSNLLCTVGTIIIFIFLQDHKTLSNLVNIWTVVCLNILTQYGTRFKIWFLLKKKWYANFYGIFCGDKQ